MDEARIPQEVQGPVDRHGSQTLLVAAEPVHEIVGPHGTSALDELPVDALANRRQPKIVLAAEIVRTTEKIVFFFLPEGPSAH
jgi:hypothetical protein